MHLQTHTKIIADNERILPNKVCEFKRRYDIFNSNKTCILKGEFYGFKKVAK